MVSVMGFQKKEEESKHKIIVHCFGALIVWFLFPNKKTNFGLSFCWVSFVHYIALTFYTVDLTWQNTKSAFFLFIYLSTKKALKFSFKEKKGSLTWLLYIPTSRHLTYHHGLDIWNLKTHVNNHSIWWPGKSRMRWWTP